MRGKKIEDIFEYPHLRVQSLLCDFAPVRELLFDAVQDRDRILSFGGRPGRSQANGVLSPEIIQITHGKADGPFLVPVGTAGNSPAFQGWVCM